MLVVSCGPSKDKGKRPIFEVLTVQPTGGAQVQFYEILSEEREIKMLENDEFLRGKFRKTDINTSNFVILNMGEQTSGGHSVTVDKVEELPDKIVITVKETHPGSSEMATSVISYPYTIVRVNSKKPIEIR